MAYAIKDSCNTFLYERSTGKPFLYADYLNSASLKIEGDAVFATAKGMNKIAFEGAKKGTFTMDTEIFEFKYLAVLLGGQLTKGSSDISKRHVGTIDSSKSIIVPGTAIPSSICVFKVGRDNKTHQEEVTVKPTNTASGQDTKLTWTSGVDNGDKIVVYYLVRVDNATKINISDSVNHESFKIVGETSMKDEFSQEALFQFVIYNAKPQVNVEINLSATDVSSFSATFDISLDENNRFVEFTLLEDNATLTRSQVQAIEDTFVSKK